MVTTSKSSGLERLFKSILLRVDLPTASLYPSLLLSIVTSLGLLLVPVINNALWKLELFRLVQSNSVAKLAILYSSNRAEFPENFL